MRLRGAQEAEFDHRSPELVVAQPTLGPTEHLVNLEYVALETALGVPIGRAREFGLIASLIKVRLGLGFEHRAPDGAVVRVAVESIAHRRGHVRMHFGWGAAMQVGLERALGVACGRRQQRLKIRGRVRAMKSLVNGHPAGGGGRQGPVRHGGEGVGRGEGCPGAHLNPRQRR